MLVLTLDLDRPGGVRISTGSGDIWLAVQYGSTPDVCKMVIEAPQSCKVLRTELLSPGEIKCSNPKMKGILTGELQKLPRSSRPARKTG